jgi:outer membrane protein assembly factor BamD
MAGVAVALMAVSMGAQVTGSSQTTTDPATGKPQESVTITSQVPSKHKRIAKDDQVKQTKDTKAANKQEAKYNPLIGKDSQLPDKQLYDKAMAQAKSGHYDVARLDLQTLLNTYPDSQFQMRAKLAVADCWYKEGGSAALAQAEQEYTDFITFFPNAPEAAEAQIRVGDIYFKQMDVPDRDYTKAVKAEDAYRTMLKQYPDAPTKLLLECKQKLREVQEVMATREAELGVFYASHENWPASIARFETVVNTYPQYSHMDDVLLGVGDGYAAEAKNIRAQPLPEGPKAKLLEEYDGRAAAAYREVVLNHAAAPHVEDAKERLAEMGLPIPTPTPQQVAASEELEGSRAQYTMAKRLELLFLRKPDTVVAATKGDPPLDDPPAVTAPSIVTQVKQDYADAFDPKGAADRAAKKVVTDGEGTPASEGTAPAAPAAPLAFEEVPTSGNVNNTGATTTMQESAPASGSGKTTGVGVEILTPGVSSGSVVPASTLPAASGAPDPNNGLNAVGPKDSAALPAAEAPATAPDQVNEVNGQTQPTPVTNKSDYDKTDESSSKHKPKKGVDKLNPF